MFSGEPRTHVGHIRFETLPFLLFMDARRETQRLVGREGKA